MTGTRIQRRHHSPRIPSKSLTFHHNKRRAVPIISAETVSGEWAACVFGSICHSALASRLKRVTYACHGGPGCLSDQPWGDSDASCLSSSLARKTCHLSAHMHVHGQHAHTHTPFSSPDKYSRTHNRNTIKFSGVSMGPPVTWQHVCSSVIM